MRAILIGSMFFAAILFGAATAYADVWVNGYTRKDGTYVTGHYRSNPDGNPYNNYSFPGNTNPYTGVTAPGDPDTYLQNYYGSSGGSSGSSYTPYTFSSYTSSYPTCPLNSYYDGISSCKCTYGYVAQGDKCVSKDSLCTDQMGYGATYDSLKESCKCRYGYVIGEYGKCELGTTVCSDKFGIGADFDSLSNKCECRSGYTFNGQSCVRASTYSAAAAAYSYAPAVSSCPAHSHGSITDSTKCACDMGYQVNTSQTACEIAQPVGMPVTADNCVASFGTGAVNLNNRCYCSKGYVWNSHVTACIPGGVTLTRYLEEGSAGSDVVALKNFLGLNNYYFGSVNTPYDEDTSASVTFFQETNNLPSTGTVGPKTRKVLNGLIK